MIEIVGTCKVCPDYHRPTPDGKNCEEVTECPGSRQFLKPDLSCEECKSFTSPSQDLRSCGVQCEINERVLEDGSCFECPIYS